METIRNYVEALFASLPQTAELTRIRGEMLANLEEKYNDLIWEGKSEAEAAGVIIAGVGSAADLRAELGLANDAPQPQAVQRAEQKPAPDPELMREYLASKQRMAVMIAIGVALFILSPVLYMFGQDVLQIKMLGYVLMFGAVAAGVALCILAGFRKEGYEQMLGIGEYAERPEGKRADWAGLFAGIAFPLATVVYLCMGFFRDLWHPGWIIFVLCGVLTGAVAVVDEFVNGKQA